MSFLAMTEYLFMTNRHTPFMNEFCRHCERAFMRVRPVRLTEGGQSRFIITIFHIYHHLCCHSERSERISGLSDEVNCEIASSSASRRTPLNDKKVNISHYQTNVSYKSIQLLLKSEISFNFLSLDLPFNLFSLMIAAEILSMHS